MPHYQSRKQTAVKRATIEPLVPETEAKPVAQSKKQRLLADAVNRVKKVFAWARKRKVHR